MEGEGSQGANRGADSKLKELEDAYRSAIDAACEAKKPEREREREREMR